ncbi:MAG: zinc ribbon domain-containing protein [Chloroflexi bacterium]|nr:zinc ribbon domain-containing protein [Chloroflexota bacterium]
MPIYEYRCQECNRTSSFFTRSISQAVEPVCSSCGSQRMERLMSAFAHHKTVAQVHEESGSPPAFPTPDYYSDPRNIGRHVEETFQKHDVELPQSIREKIDAARQGVMPKELDV